MPDGSLKPGTRVLAITKEPWYKQNPPADYVELGITSPYSFLRGASLAIDLAWTAYQLGYHAIGIADRNTMAGIVRIHMNARGGGMRPVIGCRLDLVDAPSFLAYPKDRAAYGRLCTLLSRGKMRDLDGKWQAKGECHITLEMLAAHCEGVHLIVFPPEDLDAAIFKRPTRQKGHLRLVEEALVPFETYLADLREALPSLSHIAATYLYRGDDHARITRLDRIAKAHRLSILATNDVYYATPDRRPLQDVMTCIREKTTIREAGHLLHPNAERHLKSPDEMMWLFRDWPHAIHATRAVADACKFDLRDLKYEYPDDLFPENRTAQQHLEILVREGLEWRYPDGSAPGKVRDAIAKELKLIGKLDIARYFITVQDVVRFARSLKPPILCQGRGSAANSAVCYCLGITSVDPAKTDVLFERFISARAQEHGIESDPPDIDVDFEHERREEVIQHIYDRYGREHAGLCATVIHYRPRSAVREVGKAMGLTADVTAAMAQTVWGSWGKEVDEAKVEEAGLDLEDPDLKRVIALTDQLIELPRHLSQHVGGFILTRNPLIDTVPVGNGAMKERSFIEWDKDDIDELGILKIDVLALGMLTCISKAFKMIKQMTGDTHTLASISEEEDDIVFDMLCAGESLGVFQVESRAQMNMLPRLKPRTYYDLVVEVAIVRPGPIQGDMVHPYLKQRATGKTPVFPGPAPEKGPPDELENILKRTWGVPIFQEQAIQISIDAAKFNPDEAYELRKAMATFRARGTIHELEGKFVSGMTDRGYDPEFAQRCFNQIKGFGDYGFPESHAASFAHLVYVSSWIKCYYPDAFAAALLNSQPMGFYAPAQIIRDAQENGVTILQPDVNHSDWDNLLEPTVPLALSWPSYKESKSSFAGWKQARDKVQRAKPGHMRHALRLGFRQIDGISEDVAKAILKVRDTRFTDLEDLKARTGIPVAAIRKLAAADAFRSMGLDRRQALWESRALRQAPALPLFSYAEARSEGTEANEVQLPETALAEHVVSDYQTLRLSLKAHPFEFLRDHYDHRGFTANARLGDLKSGRKVQVSGLVLIRQRPGSASGVCFITIEDETGVANLVIWPKTFEKFRKVIMTSRLMEVRGYVQTDENVIHVVAEELVDASGALAALSDDLLRQTLARADHVVKPLPSGLHRHPRNVSIIPKSRDFH